MPDCRSCGGQLLPGALACSHCHALVHADRLKVLAREASEATDPTERLRLWREALDLLPHGSRQAEAIRARIAQDVQAVDTSPAPDDRSWLGRLAGAGGALGTAALVLWKLKAFVFLALTKGKVLLLGLTKWKMMVSMFVSLGVYWAAFGWRFAVGLLASLYVHEMGHVFALQRYGIRASAPMFVPGLGAFVRLDQYPQTVREDARVGLAGPVWGIAAALFAWGVGVAAGWPSWVAVGKVGGWLNLFNLIPFWQLDGSRGLRALDRTQRWLLLAVVAGMWMLTGDGILILIGAVLAFRIATDTPPDEPSWDLFLTFAAVLAIGSGMTLIDVPGLDGTSRGTVGP
ncbi:MAG: site-2 protease family protein [Alphaproteobacteria bacterium]|nr:site-2 protease family protein [Alphaproteobacteria bacterium]MCB9692079.1 site-2 protease family protein [Alphaproteobacteria bacterium]